MVQLLVMEAGWLGLAVQVARALLQDALLGLLDRLGGDRCLLLVV